MLFSDGLRYLCPSKQSDSRPRLVIFQSVCEEPEFRYSFERLLDLILRTVPTFVRAHTFYKAGFIISSTYALGLAMTQSITLLGTQLK